MKRPRTKVLGLIGLGSFGRFAAPHLARQFDVRAYDAADMSLEAADLGIRWAPLPEVAACPYVVIAVPLQRFADALRAASPHLTPGSLVLDVGSVKLEPLRQMLEILPEEVEIVGTHPLFGPQSGAGGLAGLTIAICPARTRRLPQLRDFLTRHYDLNVVVCEAEEHDREVARTQALAQFIGRGLAGLEESSSPVRTPAYDRLLEVAATVGDDSWELFAAIQQLNPYASEVRAALLRSLCTLEERLATRSEGDPTRSTDG